MTPFDYRGARLHAERVPLDDIALQVGTPCYVYSRAHIESQWRAFDAAFGDRQHQVCYAVKANSNLAVLNILARLGSGFDIVSVGELERVLAAGGDPGKIVFSGVGKGAHEIRRALEVRINCINAESEAELARINDIAGSLGMRAPVSLRVNPDVDANTHPYIATGLRDSKFGVPMSQARDLYRRAREMPHLRIVGVDCHIGSQLVALAPFADAVERVALLVDELLKGGIELEHVDFGGGLGIRYRDESPPAPQVYVDTLLEKLDSRARDYSGIRIMIEPGRAIVGEAGVLLTRVEYTKHGEAKNFAVVDAGMNDLMRPALYSAWHEIVPVIKRDGATPYYDVVGPVCESGDFIGRERALNVDSGDLLAIRTAGAYGAVMSSNYNSRPRAPEVVVDGERFHVVRRRETVAELFAAENIVPD